MMTTSTIGDRTFERRNIGNLVLSELELIIENDSVSPGVVSSSGSRVKR